MERMADNTKPLPSLDRLNELFRLDHETGKLYNTVPRGRNHLAPAGAESGCLHRPSGYLTLRIDNKLHKLHRIVFAIANARQPEGPLDHINGDRLDNRPCNLREATVRQNTLNRGPQKNNTSGRKGVSWNRLRQKWQTHIKVNDKSTYLGLFDDIEDAAAAYNKVAVEHFGEFAKLS